MAVVTKILEQTLTAGQTAVVFTDTDIPNSLIRVFSSNSDVIPVSRILSGNSLTVTYEAQNYNMDVALEIVKQGLDIVDNLTSTDTDKALSAKQGKALKDSLDTLSTTVAGLVIPEDITDLNDVEITDIEDGQILAWDDVEQKFVNVDLTISNTHTYSTNEQVIGVWIDGSTIYEKTYSYDNDVAISMTGWTDLNTYIPNDVNFASFINAWGVDANGTNQGTFLCGLNASSHVQMQSMRNGSGNINVRKIVLQYTKQS